MFELAFRMDLIITLTFFLLIQIIEVFLQYKSKLNKYAKFQMMWYSFSGMFFNSMCGYCLFKQLNNKVSVCQETFLNKVHFIPFTLYISTN